jgi:hypothetical protein
MADGHGDNIYFRSARGARFAVEASIEISRDFLSVLPFEPLSDRSIHFRICRALTEKWIAKIRNDLENHPLSDEETITNLNNAREFCRYMGNLSDEQKTTLSTTLPYGTTCLVFLVTERFLLFTQIGDHDIITLSRDGIVTRPFPVAAIQDCTSTESLILPDAGNLFEVYYSENSADYPRMIIGATDGYGSAYKYVRNWEEFPARDLLNCLKTMGTDKTRECLPGLLKDLSKAGASGDDISLGIIFDAEGIENFTITKTLIPQISLPEKIKIPVIPSKSIQGLEHRKNAQERISFRHRLFRHAFKRRDKLRIVR